MDGGPHSHTMYNNMAPQQMYTHPHCSIVVLHSAEALVVFA